MSAPLDLRDAERQLVADEVAAVLQAAQHPASRERLTLLAAAAEEGVLDEDDQRELERIVELGLQSGRVRALYGPGGEQTALRLYRRLPSGAEVSRSASEVSEALATLTGKVLESVELQSVGPGSFTLRLAAEGAELSIRLDRQGARLASVGI